jgi:uncharacterized protein (TIGR02145 family)
VITPYIHDGSNGEVIVEAIVAPHTGTGSFTGRTITFTTGGNDYIYKVSNNFESGKVYKYTFTLATKTQTPDGMTNCYIVKPGETLEFPVSRAYTHTSSGFTSTLRATDKSYTSSFTTPATVVWSDASVINTATVSGNGKAAMVTVKTRSNSGNAVVAIKNSSGVIVWSWHIWVTNYDPDDGKTTSTYTKNGFTFMDRNLGATKASLGSGEGTGLFYQWGRKDPFPATLAPDVTQPGGGKFTTASSSTSDNGTVKYTIQNPGVFLIGFEDWHYATRDDTLWGHNDVKSIYDPCPAGWRVPIYSSSSNTNSPWYGFTTSKAGSFSEGYSWGGSTDAQYPAAGWRRYLKDSPGKLESVGVYGNYWSASKAYSTTDEKYASVLFFKKDQINTDASNSRGNACSVRCVKEKKD